MISSRRVRVCLAAVFFVEFLGVPCWAQEQSLREFKSWLIQYSQGKIEFKTRPDSQRGRGGQRRWLDRTRTVEWQHMVDLFGDLRQIDNEKAAQLLVDAAKVRFRRNPSTELKKDRELMPWRIRAMGLEVLGKLRSEESRSYLRSLCGNPDENRESRVVAAKALGRQRDERAIGPLSKALGEMDEELGVAAATSLGVIHNPDALTSLLAALETGAEPVRASSMEAITRIIDKPARALDRLEKERVLRAVLDALKDGSWRVRAGSVTLLSKVRSAKSIPRLIDALKAEQPPSKDFRERVRSLILNCLRELTGAYFSSDEPEKWVAWWEREQDRFQLPTASEEQRTSHGTKGSFFGIPVTSNRVIFVLDHSGSMRDLIGKGQSGPDRERSKWIRAVDELESALIALDDSAKFNVILFADKVKQWSKGLKKASAENKKSLISWLRRQEPDGSTNLYGGLARALKIPGIGYPRTATKLEVDTIYVLSDGNPTSGELVRGSDILRAVRETNQVARVQIHAISFGNMWSELMPMLAKQNDGTHVNHGRGEERRRRRR